MSRKCLKCGGEILESANFCAICGTLTNEIDKIGGLIKDIQKSQIPLKTVEEIKVIIGSTKKKKKIKWKKIRKIALLLLFLNISLFIIMLFIGSIMLIPAMLGQIFWTVSFILSFVFLCIYGSIRLGYVDKVESGVYKIMNRDYERAIDDYLKALKRDSEDINAWRCIGYVYLTVNEYKEAVEACKIGLEIDPTDKVLWWILASAYQINHNEEKEKEAWNKLAEFGLDGEISIELSGKYPYFRVK